MNRNHKVCGEYPRTLYRFFQEKKYAERFVTDGYVRAGQISSYQEIECGNRRDATEGEGHYLMPGRVISGIVSKDPNLDTKWLEEEGLKEHKVSHSNSIFLLCCSTSLKNEGEKIQRFGPCIVKIHMPVALAIDLDFGLNGMEGNGEFLIDGRNVEYTKGEVREKAFGFKEVVDLGYIQKPRSFQVEDEYRYCLIYISSERMTELKGKEYLEFSLGRKLDYAEIIK